MNKRVLLSLAAVLICCACVVGSTVAWLADRTSVTNTFTSGDISMTLTETTGEEYKIIPGATIAKNPTVNIYRGSEEAWLFVKVEETNNPNEYISYTLEDGWTELTAGVYYRESPAALYNVTYNILKDNAITVKDTLTEEDLATLRESGVYPQLLFTAYAVQKSGVNSAEEAWELAKNL